MSAAESTLPRVIRTYSEEERTNALALYDNVGSLERVAKTLGIPKSTVYGWLTGNNHQSHLRTQKALDLAQKFENAAHQFIELASKKAKKADFNHLMTGAGIAVDKMQLLRGQPTDISANIERVELTVVLQDALADAINVTE